MIALPPKLYLDTNHLVNIARMQEGSSLGSSEMYASDYTFINKCIKDGLCTPIFNFFAPLEWIEGKATEKSALRIASVLDQSPCIYQLEADTFIYMSEILAQCKEIDSTISFPPLPIFHCLQKNGGYKPAHTIMAQNVSDFDFGQVDKKAFPDRVPVVTISKHVIESLRWEEKNTELCRKRISGFKAALEETKAQAGEDFTRLPKYAIVGWMKRFLQIDKVLAASGLKTDVDELLEQVDIAKCPAVSLYVGIWENMIKSNHTPEDNDCDDIIYLPVIPYADVSLIERRLAGWSIQVDNQLKTKLFGKPSDAANALSKYLNIDR